MENNGVSLGKRSLQRTVAGSHWNCRENIYLYLGGLVGAEEDGLIKNSMISMNKNSMKKKSFELFFYAERWERMDRGFVFHDSFN